MPTDQTLPCLWLLSDARNDARLESLLPSLPRKSGFVFRHYHLAERERRRRFRTLRHIAHRAGHIVILSATMRQARCWGADGIYGKPSQMGRAHGNLLRIATVHSPREMAAANRAGADAVMLSPVFPTRSHPGAQTLGPVRFRFMAEMATMPVIALGGMTAHRARHVQWPRWAAIDGLSA